MKISAVDFIVVKKHPDFRIDADYYEPQYQELERFLFNKKTRDLSDYAIFVKKGIFDISPSNYVEKDGIPFLRSGDLKDEFIFSNAIIQISNSAHDKEKKTELLKDDLLMAKVGTIGDVAINLGFEKLNFSQNVIGIKIKKDYKPISGFLLSFLNCSYGRNQVNRVLSGQVQQKLTLEDVKKVKIIGFSTDFQKLSSQLVCNAYMHKEKSINLYSQAEQILLSELGLKDWKPKHQLSFVKKFSDSTNADRIDAEYFQPMYDQLISVINDKGAYTIREIQRFNGRGVQPVYVEDGDIKVVTSKNLGRESINYWNLDNTTQKEWDTNQDARIRKFDILIYTTGAYVGRTNCYLQDGKVLASNHVNILRVNRLNPIYVAVYLNSIIGQMQVERCVSGSAQVELYPSDISKFVVWKAPEAIQREIEERISEAYEAKSASKKLLDIAKRGVEMAIEKSEEEAEKWLNQEVKNYA